MKQALLVVVDNASLYAEADTDIEVDVRDGGGRGAGHHVGRQKGQT